jgi:hypothetical protein
MVNEHSISVPCHVTPRPHSSAVERAVSLMIHQSGIGACLEKLSNRSETPTLDLMHEGGAPSIVSSVDVCAGPQEEGHEPAIWSHHQRGHSHGASGVRINSLAEQLLDLVVETFRRCVDQPHMPLLPYILILIPILIPDPDHQEGAHVSPSQVARG